MVETYFHQNENIIMTNNCVNKWVKYNSINQIKLAIILNQIEEALSCTVTKYTFI